MKRKNNILVGIFFSWLIVFSSEIQNEKVTENPERKVDTVESKKLRDRAKLSIEINKMEAEKINGYLNSKGELFISFFDKIQDAKSDILFDKYNLKAISGTTLKNKKISLSKGLKREEMEKILDQTSSFKIKLVEVINKENGEILVKDINENEEVLIGIYNGSDLVKSYQVGIIKRDGRETEAEDLGTYTLTVDGRFKTEKAKYWYVFDGRISASQFRAPNGTTYLEMFSFSGFEQDIFSDMSKKLEQDITIIEPNYMTSHSQVGYWLDNGTTRIAYTHYGALSYVGISVPINITMNNFKKNLTVGEWQNQGYVTRYPYKFKMTLSDGKVYTGEVDLKGDTSFVKNISTATLDFTNFPKLTQDYWESEVTGEAKGKNGKFTLKFNNSDKLFQMGSVGGRKQVTNKITYKIGNNSEVTLDGTVVDIDLNNNSTNDIKLLFDETGFHIAKLTNEEINTVLVITPKYNDISLGTLNLTVTNNVNSMEEISFQIDKRFGNVKMGNWISPNGTLKDDSGNKIGKYPKLVKVEQTNTNTLRNIDSVKAVESIGNEYVNFKEYIGEKAVYRYWKDNSSNNEIAFPFSRNLKRVTKSDYGIGNESLIIVSKKDLEENVTGRNKIENTFTITVEEEDEKYPLYKGKISEEYVGIGVYTGSGDIDLTTLRADGKKYTFSNSVISELQDETEDILSKESHHVAITNIKGSFVDSRGLVGETKDKNIANKIKVEKISNGKSLTEDVAISENGELSVTLDNITFGIDETSGGLTISKNNNTKLKQVKISYYYSPEDITLTRSVTEKDVLLGEFTLNIEDLDVEIDGDGTLDFGNLAYTEEHKKQTREERYRIKNLDNKKVNFGVSKEEGVMYLTSDGTPGVTKENEEENSKIPLTNISVEQVDNNTFDLQATAEITQETKAGNYSGEIEVTVTLDEKK